MDKELLAQRAEERIAELNALAEEVSARDLTAATAGAAARAASSGHGYGESDGGGSGGEEEGGGGGAWDGPGGEGAAEAPHWRGSVPDGRASGDGQRGSVASVGPIQLTQMQDAIFTSQRGEGPNNPLTALYVAM